MSAFKRRKGGRSISYVVEAICYDDGGAYVGRYAHDDDDLNDSHDFLISVFVVRVATLLMFHIRYIKYPDGSFWFWAFAWQLIN